MNTPQFCNLCDVSLDLHDGPNTCDTATQKAFIIELPFALIWGTR